MLVTIAEPYDFAEAMVLRSKLQAYGIKTHSPSDNIVSVMPHITMGLGGYMLQVYRNDAEDAREILEEFIHAQHISVPADMDDIPGYRCPLCHSPKVSAQGSWWGLMMYFMTVVCGAVPKSNRKGCADCGHEFKAGRMTYSTKMALMLFWGMYGVYNLVFLEAAGYIRSLDFWYDITALIPIGHYF